MADKNCKTKKSKIMEEMQGKSKKNMPVQKKKMGFNLKKGK